MVSSSQINMICLTILLILKLWSSILLPLNGRKRIFFKYCLSRNKKMHSQNCHPMFWSCFLMSQDRSSPLMPTKESLIIVKLQNTCFLSKKEAVLSSLPTKAQYTKSLCLQETLLVSKVQLLTFIIQKQLQIQWLR